MGRSEEELRRIYDCRRPETLSAGSLRLIFYHQVWLSSGGKHGQKLEHRGRKNWANTSLNGVDFSKANLDNAPFLFCQLRDARFVGAVIRGSNFIGCDLTGADFSGAMIQETTFESANYKDACFEGATLIDVAWEGWAEDEEPPYRFSWEPILGM